MKARAIIAEDEPLLRARLREALAALWPDLEIVAEAEDGLAAVIALNQLRPDIAFLDIRMPGASGMEVARSASGLCHVVFLTAYDDYAIQAFDAGAVDYLLKPLDLARLATAVTRLQQRLLQAPADLSLLAQRLQEPGWLRWIHAACGLQMRIIPVEEIAGFVAEAKYTRLLGIGFDAHIRKTIKELAASLEPERFCQISRGAVVNLGRVEKLTRDGSGGMRLWVEGNELVVTQPYQHLFKQM